MDVFMKKLKIYKSAIALLVGASVLLLSGCSSTNNSSNGANKEEKSSSGTYLTIYFEVG